MKPIVTNIIISALKGESGSNPEIHSCFPNDSGIKRDKIIEHVLPTGSRSGDVYEYTYKDQDLIVFVSELQQESRNDIITIGLLLNNHAEKNTVISILKTIFSEFQVDNIKVINEFADLAKKLFIGLNTGNFNYNSYSFNIHGYISTTGMSLEKELRKVKGGLF